MENVLGAWRGGRDRRTDGEDREADDQDPPSTRGTNARNQQAARRSEDEKHATLYYSLAHSPK